MALIAVLEALDPPVQEGATNSRRQLICVANTHIHANPELNDVKLWQVSPLFAARRVLTCVLRCMIVLENFVLRSIVRR